MIMHQFETNLNIISLNEIIITTTEIFNWMALYL